ncbi:hypothetical protein Q8G48_28150, partial [Klebsiella pneumoniae]|uniref:hypothetical protein n=1 Tax=Klebsiella pneumoniae TaxID=573 RepID=UPI003013D389
KHLGHALESCARNSANTVAKMKKYSTNPSNPSKTLPQQKPIKSAPLHKSTNPSQKVSHPSLGESNLPSQNELSNQNSFLPLVNLDTNLES